MKFLYIDASGNVEAYQAGMNTKYYILAGVALDHRNWEFVTEDLKHVIGSYFDGESIPEIHSNHLMHGKKPFDKINHMDLANDILDFVSGSPVNLFGVVINKRTFLPGKKSPLNNVSFVALEEMVNRFHKCLEREDEMGMIISDVGPNSHVDGGVRNTFEQFRGNGTRFLTPNRIIDTIFFAPSETAIGIQLADFVAYTIRMKYEKANDSFFIKIKGKFEHYNGKVHGFKVIG